MKGASLLVASVIASVVGMNTCYGRQKNDAAKAAENYGNTLNIGLGIGYYGFLGQSVPFIFANYEFDVTNNFTLAPSVGFASYRSSYNVISSSYYYRQTVIPVGVKGTYYCDKLLGAGPDWDFYGALSLGYNYTHIVWDNSYNGTLSKSRKAYPLYWDLHIGAEYHLSNRAGIFLDLSTGVSTLGLALHHL